MGVAGFLDSKILAIIEDLGLAIVDFHRGMFSVYVAAVSSFAESTLAPVGHGKHIVNVLGTLSR